MFEASTKAKRIDKGQTIEGRIVAIGPEVAFVDVGGKGEATIELDELKGGYEVSIARQRAFCPISQIDTLRNTDPSVHEGRVYEFRIIEYKEGGRNLVVSRRALLEEEQRP